MIEGTLSPYGGSSQEHRDSQRTQKFLGRRGKLNVRHEDGKVILSIEEMPIAPQAEHEGTGDK